MAVNLSTDSALSGLMQTYYDRKLLEFAKGDYPLWQFGQKKDIPANSGKTIQFNRYTLMPARTTPLTEGSNPTASNLTTTTVTATLAEYGDFVQISSLIAGTAIDPNLDEKVGLFKEQAGVTVEQLVRNTLIANCAAANVQLSDTTATTIDDLTATDVLSTANIQLGVRQLKINKAMKMDGYWICVIGANVEYDFTRDPAWVEASKYDGSSQLFKGEIGKWFNVRFAYTTEPHVAANASNVNIYSNLLFGNHAFGVVDFAKTAASGSAGRPQIVVKNPGPQDTSNPLNRFSTAGWQITFGQQVLNSDWLINIRSGATA